MCRRPIDVQRRLENCLNRSPLDVPEFLFKKRKKWRPPQRHKFQRKVLCYMPEAA
jgi:hypothetical protein